MVSSITSETAAMEEKERHDRELVSSLGDFSFVSRLGERKTTFVFKVKDNRTGEYVALKVLKDTEDEEHVARFEREIYVLEECRHPNLVRLRYSDEDNGRFYVMDYINGVNLFYAIDEFGALGIARSIEMVKSIAAAVSVMHTHEDSIIHRDLKPENIMIAYSAEKEESFILIDPGIAKIEHRKPRPHRGPRPYDTAQGQILGTIGYIPPEQMCAHPVVGPRGDIYSLSTNFYEALLGKTLQDQDETDMHFMYRMKTTGPKKLIEVCPDIPKELSDIVAKGMHIDPNQRYQTCLELKAAVEDFENHYAV